VIIVDASLAVKWLLAEADSEQALDFLQSRDLAAPELLYIEVAGVIVRRGNMDKTLHPQALLALEKWTTAWADHAVKNIRVTQRRLLQASVLALRLGTPLKDCVYLAVAIEQQTELATCDAKFRDKALAVYPHVRLLSEYAASA
jgi:predicted nucleic acid-binding protein